MNVNLSKNLAINTLVAEATEQEPRHQGGTILPFDDGRLLLAYSHFYDRSAKDTGASHIVGRWSHDEGASWSEAFELQENIGKINCLAPSLLRLPTGRILLEFMRKDREWSYHDKSGEPGELHPMVKYSDDEGNTWSKPQQITQGSGYWCSTHDRLYRTSRGRILLALATEQNVLSWLSDDEGLTWRASRKPLPIPNELAYYAEPVVVETRDGQLKMWIRNRGGRLHVAISDDDGDTWRLHSDWGPNAKNTPAMVRRIPDTDDLLIIWNNNQIRTPLTCGISRDGGDTWQHIKDLEHMRGWPPPCIHAYPSLAFLNGNAHITYFESSRHANPADDVHLGVLMSLRYRRIAVQWFYE